MAELFSPEINALWHDVWVIIVAILAGGGFSTLLQKWWRR